MRLSRLPALPRGAALPEPRRAARRPELDHRGLHRAPAAVAETHLLPPWVQAASGADSPNGGGGDGSGLKIRAAA
jgi:hypothetical protein